MKKITFTLFLICFYLLLFAQQETNYWYFGNGAGLVFNGGTPTALTNGMLYAAEGCSTISDSNGNLLFYTNGVTVWNKNHQIMTNGTGLWGDLLSLSSTQAAIIIPQPLNDSLFYIFTTDGQAGYWGGYGGIAYSIVNMNLQGGNGEVTVKNIPLLTPTSEKVAAVFHSNGTDIWILTQQWGTNAKYAWLISSAGLNVSPIISSIGLVHYNSGNFNTYAQGYMKFSSDGVRIGSVRGASGIIEVFDFNSTTGVVSNPITINAPGGAYGLEFSSDRSRLYSTNFSSQIFQWDLTLGSEILINNSRTLIHQTPFSTTMHITLGLQLGIDCRIYVTIDGLDSLGVIQSPNQLGLSCNYIHNAISLLGNSSTNGLPNFIQSYFNECNTVGINSIPFQSYISVYPNPFSNKLNLKNSNNELSEIILYDITSRKLLQQKFTNSVSLNTTQLAKGIYIYELRNNPDSSGGVIKKGKVVKE